MALKAPKKKNGRLLTDAAVNTPAGVGRVVRGLAVEIDEGEDRLDALEKKVRSLEKALKKEAKNAAKAD